MSNPGPATHHAGPSQDVYGFRRRSLAQDGFEKPAIPVDKIADQGSRNLRQCRRWHLSVASRFLVIRLFFGGLRRPKFPNTRL